MRIRGTEELSEFLHEYDKLTLFSLVLILAVPFVLDLIFSLQPPWPPHSTYITGFIELGVIFFSFSITIRSKTLLRKIQNILMVFLIVLFFLYFFLYSMFVFETPLTGERVVAGFECSDKALIVAKEIGESCPFLSEATLASAQYEAEVIWTPPSVRLVEFMIFVCWTSFFLFATALRILMIVNTNYYHREHVHCPRIGFVLFYL